MTSISNKYVLGATPEIVINVYDTSNNLIDFEEASVTVQTPTGEIHTISGGDFQRTSSGMYYCSFHPTTRGWYEYVIWVKGTTGLEGTSDPDCVNGFEVIDLLY